jgi:hypothetical protein
VVVGLVVTVVGAAVDVVAGGDGSAGVVRVDDVGTEATVDAPVSAAGGAQPTAKNTNTVASGHHTRICSLHPTVSPRRLDRSRINLATAQIRQSGVVLALICRRRQVSTAPLKARRTCLRILR